MRRPLSSRTVPTRLNIKAADTPPSGPSNAGEMLKNEQQSRSHGRIQTLEALANSLREQLHAVDSLIESEKSA
jgi:hypothetical protein